MSCRRLSVALEGYLTEIKWATGVLGPYMMRPAGKNPADWGIQGVKKLASPPLAEKKHRPSCSTTFRWSLIIKAHVHRFSSTHVGYITCEYELQTLTESG